VSRTIALPRGADARAVRAAISKAAVAGGQLTARFGR
jgi:hypothetical protein